MILTVIIYVFALILSSVAFVLPSIQILPDIVFEAITNIFTWILELNSMLFWIDNFMNAFVFFLNFLNYYLIYKISVMVINYFRGAKGLN